MNVSQLDAVLNRFYDPSASNDEKRLIEAELNTFRNQSGAISICCQILNESSNAYSQWFACQTLEFSIRRNWQNEANKSQIKGFLFEYLVNRGASVPKFVRTKLCQAIVEIAKKEWPSDFPEYFQNIEKAISSSSSESQRAGGLGLLLHTVEEFASESSGIFVRRRVELRRHFFDHEYAKLLFLLSRVLQDQVKICDTNVTSETESISTCFEIVTILISWIPDIQHISMEILEATFLYLRKFKSSHSVQALSCINELLDKNYLPSNANDFVVRLSCNVLEILESLVSQSSDPSEECADGYLNQCTRYICIFLRKHFRKVKNSSTFPANQLMQLLIKYTLLQSDVVEFTHTLEIWEYFVEEASVEGGALNANNSLFTEAMTALLPQLVEKLLWCKSESILEQLNDEPSSLDRESESSDAEHDLSEIDRYWDRLCILIVGITYLPEPHNSATFHPLVMYVGNYLEQFIQQVLSGNSSAKIVDDCATLLHLMSKLAEWFCMPNVFQKYFPIAKQFCMWTVQILERANEKRLYSQDRSAERLSSESFLLLTSFCGWFAMIRKALEANDAALAALLSGFVDSVEKHASFLDSLGRLALQPFDSTITPAPERVLLSSVEFIKQLSCRITGVLIWDLPSISLLFGNLRSIVAVIPQQVQTKLFVTISDAILLQVKLNNTKEGDPRFQQLQKVFESTVGTQAVSLMSKTEATDFIPERLRAEFVILAAVSKSLETRETVIKAFAAPVLTSVLPRTLEVVGHLFERLRSGAYNRQAASSIATARDALELVVAILGTFARQLGDDSCHATVHSLLEYFSNHAAMLVSSGSGGVLLLLKLLKLLSALIMEQAGKLKEILPRIASLCFNEIASVFKDIPKENLSKAMSDNVIELHTAHFVLIEKMLKYHWRWFVNVQIENNTQRLVFVNDAAMQYFVLAFQMILESLRRDDLSPQIYKETVVFLDEFNRSHLLHRLEWFNTHMKMEYVDTLVKITMAQSHQSVQDELISAIFGLVQEDISRFYQDYLPKFLQSLSVSQGSQVSVEDMQRLVQIMGDVRDFPSFSRNFLSFANDTRCIFR